MGINNTIRIMREIKNLSQEEMAEKLEMSPSGYAKIERGETKLYLEKLQQIAQIFNIDVTSLIESEDKNLCLVIGENNSNYYATNESLAKDNESLKQALNYKDQLIAQKDREIEALKEIIQLLKKST